MNSLLQKPARTLFALAPIVLFLAPAFAQVPKGLTTFPLKDVKLSPGVFRQAESTDLKYILELVPDRLLAPFLREAGLKPKAESYTNWENTGLDGHIGGHYVSALAMMVASTGNKEAQTRLDYMVSELKRCQDAYGDGYIGGVPGSKELWPAVLKGDLTGFRRKWVPLYNIHKTFAGLRDAWTYAGNETAKGMFIRFGDWFVNLANTLSPQKMQEMLSIEHGGINETLADVYALTGDKKYLDAAYKFSHRAILEPLEKSDDKLTNLHANTQIPKVIGFKRIADLSADTAFNKAAEFFWKTVTEKRSVAIGGNSVREHFTPDFSTMMTSEQGPETCNTYNMLKLTELLFLGGPEAKYMDFYERALYNHILSSQHPDKGGFVYFTPMRPGHYRVYSQPQTSMWCCVGSGMENHAKYGELIYAHDAQNLYVNLFIPSALSWKQKGLTLSQQTRFPEQEKTTLTVTAVKPGTFTIYVRNPSWVRAGAFSVLVNGVPVKGNSKPSSYFAIRRAWKKGDIITVNVPMHTTVEPLPDGLNYEAVLYGPIVLAAKLDNQNMPGLFADDSRMGHATTGKFYPLNEMPMFVSDTRDDASRIKPLAGAPLTFTAKDLVYPAKYGSLKLEPFYKVHDSRYVLYWQRENPAGIEAIKAKIAKEEAAAAALAAQTIDLVAAGEQQPEADHFIESENSSTGVNLERHWRDARSFFSYRMTDKHKEAASLRVTYFGRDRNRRFSVLVNDELLARVTLDGSKGNALYSEDYPIPAALAGKAAGVYKVKFVAENGSVAGGVYEVRLLKK